MVLAEAFLVEPENKREPQQNQRSGRLSASIHSRDGKISAICEFDDVSPEAALVYMPLDINRPPRSNLSLSGFHAYSFIVIKLDFR
jgi:hypothetical protein